MANGNRDREQLMTQMEEVIKQLRQAEEETSAATAVVTSPVVVHRTPGLLTWYKRVKQLLLLVLVLLVLYGAYALFWVDTRPTVSSFVTGVKDLSALATAEAYVMTTVEGKDNKLFGMDISVDFPGTKRTYMFLVPAKMLAGVDLKGLSESDVEVDHELKQVRLTLPHAVFLQESIQLDKLKVYTDSGLFRANMETKEGIDLIKQGQVMEKLREEATGSGILQTAEQNAVLALQNLFRTFGYQVDVKWQGE